MVRNRLSHSFPGKSPARPGPVCISAAPVRRYISKIRNKIVRYLRGNIASPASYHDFVAGSSGGNCNSNYGCRGVQEGTGESSRVVRQNKVCCSGVQNGAEGRVQPSSDYESVVGSFEWCVGSAVGLTWVISLSQVSANRRN